MHVLKPGLLWVRYISCLRLWHMTSIGKVKFEATEVCLILYLGMFVLRRCIRNCIPNFKRLSCLDCLGISVFGHGSLKWLMTTIALKRDISLETQTHVISWIYHTDAMTISSLYRSPALVWSTAVCVRILGMLGILLQQCRCSSTDAHERNLAPPMGTGNTGC
jgi:hypothetical protein